MIFKRVTEADSQQVFDIYSDSRGQEGCAWSESYPSEIDYINDMKRGDLYALYSEDGTIVGVVSIDLDDAVEGLDCWSDELSPGREISRLGVRREYQNQGLGRILLGSAMKVLKSRGYKSAHFLVAKDNERAIRSYKKLGFEYKGDCFMLGHDYLCYEKSLDEIN